MIDAKIIHYASIFFIIISIITLLGSGYLMERQLEQNNQRWTITYQALMDRCNAGVYNQWTQNLSKANLNFQPVSP